MNNKLPDHIEEYFSEKESSSEAINSREIFNATEENIDLKTDITDQEISLIATLKFNDDFLMSRGIKPVFSQYYNNYMRLKVSKDRKSRGEFVNINKRESQEDVVGMAGNLAGLGKK